jgi:hypothetical protein
MNTNIGPAGAVTGILNGFDRLVLRGSIRSLCFAEGMARYLSFAGVLLKDFGDHVQHMSCRLKAASIAEVERLERPVRYLASSSISKEQVALEIAAAHGIKSGPIAVLSCVEPCNSFEVHRGGGQLQLQSAVRKCLFLYHYWIDEAMGMMSARIQTWFPFSIQVCLNGREWLARQMDAHGVEYERKDNCFVRIEDLKQAQQLMDQQLCTEWPALMQGVANRLNPAHRQMFGPYHASYYWSAHQSEWASDLMFASPEALAGIYPQLTHGAIVSFGAQDVFRFLGKQLRSTFQGEQVSSYRTRPQGVRVKHSIKDNSIKMYDKQGQILRVETTINNVREFRTFDETAPKRYRTMRKGVSDLHRRAQVSQSCNRRYLQALQSLHVSCTVRQLVTPVCKPVEYGKQRIRALRPWAADDQRLLSVIARGEFAVCGMRNHDLVRLLRPGQHKATDHRRLAAQTGRRLRMLRAHGLIQKLSGTHRYTLTKSGREICTVILQTHELSAEKLTLMAA